jgi:hypothetical protein
MAARQEIVVLSNPGTLKTLTPIRFCSDLALDLSGHVRDLFVVRQEVTNADIKNKNSKLPLL